MPLTVTAHAAVTTGLVSITPPTDMNNVAMDGLNSRLLISSSQGVLVTDLTGQAVATLLPGSLINDVKVSPDGSTAWAADRTGNSLDQIDLTDLRVLHTFPLPAGDVLAAVTRSRASGSCSLTPACTRRPYLRSAASACSTPPPAQSGSRRPVAGAPVRPTLTLIPGTRRVLALNSGPGVAVYNFASGRPVLSQPTGTLPGACTVVDVTVAPDGQSFVPGCSNLTSVTEYRTADFGVRARYTLSYPDPQYVPYVTSVAFSGDGSMLAVGQFGLLNHSLTVLKRNATGWQGYYAKGFPYVQLTFQRGVVFSPHSTSIFTLGPVPSPKGTDAGHHRRLARYLGARAPLAIDDHRLNPCDNIYW